MSVARLRSLKRGNRWAEPEHLEQANPIGEAWKPMTPGHAAHTVMPNSPRTFEWYMTLGGLMSVARLRLLVG